MSSKEWKEYNLIDLVSFQRGHDLTVANIQPGNYPVAGSNGVIGFHNEYTTKGPGLTIGRSGNSIGVVHFYKNDFWAHNTTLYVRAFKNTDPRFIFYLLKLIDFKGFNSGSAVPSLNRNFISGIKVLAPNLSTQQQIAKILSVLDDKIELNRQTNQTLENIAQTLFKEWFINYNYPNATGEMQDSELGKIPKGWKVGSIGDIAYVQSGYAFKSRDFKDEGEDRIIKIKNISSNLVDIINTDFIDNTIAKNTSNKFKIKWGALLIAMTGAEVGKIGLVPYNEEKLWLNQRVGNFIERLDYAKHYLYLLLSSKDYQNLITNSAMGSAQPNISSSAIENISIVVPSVELITKLGLVIDPIIEQILFNQSQNLIITQLRDTLLPKLMRGEIEV